MRLENIRAEAHPDGVAYTVLYREFLSVRATIGARKKH